MSKKKPRRRASKPPQQSVGDAARCMLERGLVPVLVKPNSKQPVEKEWQKKRPTADVIATKFTAEKNIGLLLGEPSRNIVDVDLDSPEAVAAAPLILPPTGMITGRKGSRKSHYFYEAADLPTARFKLPAGVGGGGGDTLVELRSTGAQTLVPPSRHPSFEIIRWESRGDPAAVDPGELVQSVVLLAITALMAKCWPAKGNRQVVSLALAGFLLSWRLPQTTVEKVVGLAAEQAGDEEAVKRTNNVGTTATRLASGESVVSQAKLGELIGASAVRCIQRWLRESGAGVDPRSDGADASDGKLPNTNTVEQLMRVIEVELHPEVFRAEREPGTFLTANTPSGRLTFSLRGDDIRLLLGRTARRHLGRGVSVQAIDEALDQLRADAMFDGPTHEVHVRVAESRHDRAVYVDLAVSSADAVQITASGWSVVTHSPIRFLRPRMMQSLPHPERGGRMDQLWDVLNVPDDGSRVLLLVWLTAVFQPSVPCPLLFVHGEQGSAKSTLTRFMHELVDPSRAMLRPMPKDNLQLAIAAGDARVLSIDNMSSIRRETSDALCKLVTGASFPVRKFYSDSEEKTFAGSCAVMINGIPDLASSPDLADRALVLVLPRIERGTRRTERELRARFDSLRPRLLGGLFDAVSEGLRRQTEMMDPPARLERMADFCEWGCAVAPAFGCSSDEFLSLMEQNRRRLNQQAIEASVIVEPIRQFLLQNARKFEGTAQELFDGLFKCELVSDYYKNRRDWPASASSLGKILRREADALRDAGVSVTLDRHSKDASPKRLIVMELVKRQKRQPSGRRSTRSTTPRRLPRRQE